MSPSESARGSSAGSSKPADKKSSRDLIVRVVIYGALLVAVALAGVDFLAKKKATATADAWQAARNDIDENGDLMFSQLGALKQGNPTLEETELPRDQWGKYGARYKQVYTWSGIFRSYPVTVYLMPGGPNDKTVERIVGPAGEAGDE